MYYLLNQRLHFSNKSLFFVFLMFFCGISSFAGIPVKVKVSGEPTNERVRKDPTVVSNIDINGVSWESISNLKKSNDLYTTLELLAGESSDILSGKGLNFYIPNGATIYGIELRIEGHTSGGGYIEDNAVRITDKNGAVIGFDRANFATYGKEWKNGDSDFLWTYGYAYEDWGELWNDEDIKSEKFGFQISIKNPSDSLMTVFVDNIDIRVHFLPEASFCEEECMTFYVDPKTEGEAYQWMVPVGFDLISVEGINTLSIKPVEATYGIYDMCAMITDVNGMNTYGCRTFHYKKCGPGSVGDFVWLDENENGEQDLNEVGLEDLKLALYNENDDYVGQTKTDELGYYIFDNLLEGGYYIKLRNVEAYTPTVTNQGDKELDSDYEEVDGEWVSDYFYIESGLDKKDIDFGLIAIRSNISGMAWEDNNKDGINNNDEPVLPNVVVRLYQSDTILVSTSTDSMGLYSFEEIPLGEYYIVFELETFGFSDAFQGSDPLIDSDVTGANGTGSTEIIALLDLDLEGINAGMFPTDGLISGFSWEDLNKNGLMEVDEPKLSDVWVYLYDEGVLSDSVLTNETGAYLFDSLLAGDYFLQFEIENYRFTNADQGSDESIDSDVTDENGPGTTDIITIYGEDFEGVNSGMISTIGSIAGSVWEDINEDGILDPSESYLSEVWIYLFRDGSKLDSVLTDESGVYSFVDLVAGAYYLEFFLNNYKFTIANQASDELFDSDVTEANGVGTTDLILLNGEDIEGVNAGLISKIGSISGIVWEDLDDDGLYADHDSYMNNVLVKLYKNSVLDQSSHTSLLGNYKFIDLLPGEYYIEIDTNSYEFVEPFAGADPLNDSDITGSNGVGTSNTIVLDGEDIEGINAGLYSILGSISGAVWNDENENGVIDAEETFVGNAFVFLKLGDELIGSTNTNEDGTYIFDELFPGEYTVAFATTNFGFTIPFNHLDSLLDSDVTGIAGPGSTNTINLDGQDVVGVNAGLISLLGSVSGDIWEDINGDGIQTENEVGIDGVTVNLYHLEFGFFGSKITDEHGNYIFEELIEASYYIEIELENDQGISPYQQGIDTIVDSDFYEESGLFVTDTFDIVHYLDIENKDGGLYKYGSIGDFVWSDDNEDGIQDAGELGLSSVDVTLLSDDGDEVDFVQTDDAGNYLFTNLSPGTYSVQFSLPLNYIYTLQDVGSNDLIDSDIVDINNNIGTTDFIIINSGDENISIDASVVYEEPLASAVAGIVWTDNNANGIKEFSENGIENVWVYIYHASGEVLDSVQTLGSDSLGIYYFKGLELGDYYIEFALEGLGEISLAFQGTDQNLDADVTHSNGEYTTDIFTISEEPNNSMNAGLYELGSISGYMWKDINGNHLNDELTKGFNDVIVKLFNSDDVEQDFTFTASDEIDIPGYYIFEDLIPGSYYILFGSPSHTVFVDYNIGTSDENSDVNHANGLGSTELLSLLSGEELHHIDAGLEEETASIGDRVWLDENGNSKQDANESGIDGVTVHLYSESDVLLQTVVTQTLNSVSGSYQFTNVESGAYYLLFEITDEYSFVEPNVGGSDAKDSDVTSIIAYGTTNIISFDPGEVDLDVDAGFFTPAEISGLAWYDESEDGIRDVSEPLAEGVKVELRSATGLLLEETMTASDGTYRFGELLQGLYFVSFVIDGNYAFTERHVGDPLFNSDVNEIGNSALISLSNGHELEHLDAGLIEVISLIGSRIWVDTDDDGIRTTSELPMYNVEIKLYDDLGSIVEVKYTDSLGCYNFIDVEDGMYYLEFKAPELYVFAKQDMGGDDNMDSDVDEEGITALFLIENGVVIRNIDAGIVPVETFVEQESEPEFVDNNLLEPLEVNILPNPVFEYCNIVVSSDFELQEFEYDIVSLNGSTIVSGSNYNWIENQNDITISIDLRHLFSGVYYLRARINNELIVRKISIIRD